MRGWHLGGAPRAEANGCEGGTEGVAVGCEGGTEGGPPRAGRPRSESRSGHMMDSDVWPSPPRCINRLPSAGVLPVRAHPRVSASPQTCTGPTFAGASCWSRVALARRCIYHTGPGAGVGCGRNCVGRHGCKRRGRRTRLGRRHDAGLDGALADHAGGGGGDPLRGEWGLQRPASGRQGGSGPRALAAIARRLAYRATNRRVRV